MQSAQFLNRHLNIRLEPSDSIESSLLHKKIIGLSEAPYEVVNIRDKPLKQIPFISENLATYYGFLEGQAY